MFYLYWQKLRPGEENTNIRKLLTSINRINKVPQNTNIWENMKIKATIDNEKV